MSTRLSSKRKRMQTARETDNIVNQKFSMKKIQPITQTQEKLFEEYLKCSHIAAIGSAGTGKTMCAMYLALKDVMDKNDYEKVVIIRSAVQTRDQGFMPGNPTDKMAHYEGPYIDIANDLFGRGDAYSILKQKGMIKFMSSSFIRGLTFDNSIIIVDEIQNMNYEELRSITTRIGESSKIIFCGDIKQDDLSNSKNRFDRSGLVNFLKIINTIEDFSVIEFSSEDIVRSGIVKKFILSEERILAYA